MLWRVVAVWSVVILGCCFLPADERVELDRKVGRAEAQDGLSVEVRDGLAAVRSFDGARLELWGQAPVLEIAVRGVSSPRPLRLDVLNCVKDAALTTPQGVLQAQPVDGRPATCGFDVTLSDDSLLTLSPSDASRDEPYAFAVLSDIQRGIGDVDDVYARLNEDPELRFVVSTGDLVNTGKRDELVHFQEVMKGLEVPLFSTVGNHEMGAPPRNWHELFGPFNVHFTFKGVRFSLVDSGNASIDPHVYDWLDDWLDEADDEVHVVLTHVPPLDPVGLRGGGFRSRKEAAKLLEKLGEGKVDALFLGHIHSYYAFSNAGVPVYLSGGGGAIQERLDGIERHYLKVRVTPHQRIDDVAIVRIE